MRTMIKNTWEHAAANNLIEVHPVNRAEYVECEVEISNETKNKQKSGLTLKASAEVQDTHWHAYDDSHMTLYIFFTLHECRQPAGH